ncbi:ABC transporter permease subunit [Pelagibaculum spongiae]|uniref:Phosphate ABC transporter permease n=1 Tax=Pelagibaculum spongiae TaxID=2080658 RepID=A0A2V1GVG6_9GAMM|nr:ABC transporter permease subunit [Pelagibaculum spongiae]PVZ69681.1 phosphate ABC transporter permease [Pelagibaculum spongiae]
MSQELANMVLRRKWRTFKDLSARYMVGLGGMSVIAALLLIFLYLLYVIQPLFVAPGIEPVASFERAEQGQTLVLSIEEQTEQALQITDQGKLAFFSTADGKLIANYDLGLPQITVAAEAESSTGLVALATEDGRALVVHYGYKVTFPNDQRLITPQIDFPLGESPLQLDDTGAAIEALSFAADPEEGSTLAYVANGGVWLANLIKEEDFLSGDTVWQVEKTRIGDAPANLQSLMLPKDRDRLMVISQDGTTEHYRIIDGEAELVETFDLTPDSSELSQVSFLTGDISLLVANNQGELSQWFSVRNSNGDMRMQDIRQFENPLGNVTSIETELYRKGFFGVDQKGDVAIWHSTSNNLVFNGRITDQPIRKLAIAPRANAVIAESADGKMHFVKVHNEHPEVTLAAIWGEIWYEGYKEPDFVWQSSSASNDFEPKFSLTPISFGTLKAAFYAMLFAVPLSIFGACYTAYFMSPGVRTMVKPTIEIMEALPTVILGFLAGLWLAPMMEENLPGIVVLVLMLPPGVMLAAYLWSLLPKDFRHRVGDGKQAILLVPVILLIGWFSIAISPVIEIILFDGNTRSWLTSQGISFDQRNSLVVGIAMGFAVIPTIFSIAEDAVFSVPKHLTQGSLALGATPWQTLIKVVLLTASPGIFSAVMIGLGRAVGETMIVLMATGNTPVMDFSVFQGMRTLSANIAVEMPESEVGSSHYRILFLAAFVLFIFTFAFNTVAEVVRQRLRKKYSSL